MDVDLVDISDASMLICCSMAKAAILSAVR